MTNRGTAIVEKRLAAKPIAKLVTAPGIAGIGVALDNKAGVSKGNMAYNAAMDTALFSINTPAAIANSVFLRRGQNAAQAQAKNIKKPN